MSRYYYSVQPFLAWCFNHYFYGRRHYVYVAAPFHTYKNVNPTSSNPWHLYGDYYGPWWDRDPYAAHIRAARKGLEAGAVAQRKTGRIGPALAHALVAVARRASTTLFYPVVYRIDLDAIAPSRLSKAGSGANTLSDEWLIPDLDESEFSVLFFDPGSDWRARHPAIRTLGGPLVGSMSVSATEALRSLRKEIQP